MATNETSTTDQFSCSYDLNFYFDFDNVRDQDFILLVFAYFDSGPGKELCQPLYFMNILYWHYKFASNNKDKAYDVVQQIDKSINDDAGRHLLVTFLLKWHGGIPIKNVYGKEKTMLRLLENKYLQVLELARYNAQILSNKDLGGEVVTDIERKEAKNDLEFVNYLDEIIRNLNPSSITAAKQFTTSPKEDSTIALNVIIQQSNVTILSLTSEVHNLKRIIKLHKAGTWFKGTGVWFTVVGGAFVFGLAFGNYKFDNEKISLSNQVRHQSDKIDSLYQVILITKKLK